MKVKGRHYRTIWLDEEDPRVVRLIDQRALPHRWEIETISSGGAMAEAIAGMHVRGAGLIGAAAGYGMYLAALEAQAAGAVAKMEAHLRTSYRLLLATRPTAVNLRWALDRQMAAMAAAATGEEKVEIARVTAEAIAEEDAAACRAIGRHGMELIRTISERKSGAPVNILTHCNAGWLAFVDYGSATAPVYAAHDAGIAVHVWVDETRPRNQGASLTAWELGEHGVPHTLIVDNAGGHLMQHGMVDLVITGTDRTTITGDVANKIGTYLKALAAADNAVPFYVALPSSSFDWDMTDGLSQIPIEERHAAEVHEISGLAPDGSVGTVRISPTQTPAANFGFDVTPARLITGLITERGICAATREAILELYPEHVNAPQHTA